MGGPRFSSFAACGRFGRIERKRGVAYNQQKQPPAPFVLVTLTNPLDGARLPDVPSQIDTAADRTLVPLPLLESLGLTAVDDMLIDGVGGSEDTMPVFLVSMSLFSLPARNVCVVAHHNEPWILLGRDILNAFRFVLDGPRLAFEPDWSSV